MTTLKLEKISWEAASAIISGEVSPITFIARACAKNTRPKHSFEWDGEEVIETQDPNWGTPYPARGYGETITTYTPESWEMITGGVKRESTFIINLRMTSYSFYEK